MKDWFDYVLCGGVWDDVETGGVETLFVEHDSITCLQIMTGLYVLFTLAILFASNITEAQELSWIRCWLTCSATYSWVPL